MANQAKGIITPGVQIPIGRNVPRGTCKTTKMKYRITVVTKERKTVFAVIENAGLVAVILALYRYRDTERFIINIQTQSNANTNG